MTGPTLSEWTDSNVNTSWNKNNVYSELVRSFVQYKLDKKEDRLSFAQSIDGLNDLNSDQLQEIKNFSWTDSRFSGLEISNDTLKISSFKKEIAHFLAWIRSKKISIRDSILAEFNITPQDYTTKISQKIDGINSESELEKLLNSEKERRKFIKTTYGNTQTPSVKIFSWLFHDMQIEKRFSRLPDHEQRAISSVNEKLKTRQKLDTADVMTIFESWIFSETEKQKIIESYMPSITVAQALELEIIDQQAAREIKKDALESSVETGLFGSTGIEIDTYISQISDDELLMSTQGLFSNANSQKQLFEKNFFYKLFTEDFNSLISDIEKRLASESIQTLDEAKSALWNLSNVEGIEHFLPGSFIVMKQKMLHPETKVLQEVELYAEVINAWNVGTFWLVDRGSESYDARSKSDVSRQTYSGFIDFASKSANPENWVPEIEFISKQTLNHRIQTWKITDIHGSENYQSKQQIENEKTQIAEQIQARKNELTNQWVSKSKQKDDPKLKQLLQLQEEKETVYLNVSDANTKTLHAQIDEIDTEWKAFWLEKWTTFTTNGKKWDSFSILKVFNDDQKILVKWLKDEELLTYEQFVEAFKKSKAVRVSKITNFQELFSQTDHMYTKWSEFELKSGKIKHRKSKTDVEYDFLVPQSGWSKQLFKIHSIDGEMVTLSFWEVADKKKSVKQKDWEKKDEKVWEIFKVESQKYTMSVWVLDRYIVDNKLELRSLEEWKVKQEEMDNVPTPESKFGLFNFLFQGMSIASVIKGSKTAIEQITNILNEWDDDKANQFALKFFWPILWKDGKTDMQSRVEQTQKKSMEEFVQRLKDINSKPATLLIKSWLKDPRTPEYKKEAGMFYMFEKYWALCAKEMYEYQWQSYWYQKMWGIIGDSVWVEVHERNNKLWLNTTEEELVYNLMSKQVNEWGYNGVKRRSKLAKELKALRGKGKEEEWATGLKDGSNERDVEERITWWLSELSSWNYPNSFGWLESVTEKWGSMKQMNMIPFVMMYSGMAYNFEKDLLDKAKNFPWQSRMLLMMRFLSYSWDIDIINQTILRISERLSEKYPWKYPDIFSDANWIFKNQKNNSIAEIDKQKATIKFYQKYWEEINNILYLLNTGGIDDVDNKMIFLEKEDDPIFKKYYDKLQAYMWADVDFTAKAELFTDQFAEKWTSGLNLKKASGLFNMRTGWVLAHGDAWNIMWTEEVVPEFIALTKRQYDPDPVKNRAIQKKLIEINLRDFLSAIMGMHAEIRTLANFNSPTWKFSKLNDWGVYFDQLVNAWASSESIAAWENTWIIDKFVNNIITHENGWKSYERATVVDSEWRYKFKDEGAEDEKQLPTFTQVVQWKAWDILNQQKRPSNIKQATRDDYFD